VFQGLSGVADGGQGGTAGEVFAGWDLKKWPIISKTGTAQVTGKADTSLFVGYGPALDPRFVSVAVLEESGFGADAAAPVVKRVFETLAPDAAPKPPPPPPGTPAPEGSQGVVPTTGRSGP
jgi:penicillin-binding protein 2